jgi:hypothetical protein
MWHCSVIGSWQNADAKQFAAILRANNFVTFPQGNHRSDRQNKH